MVRATPTVALIGIHIMTLSLARVILADTVYTGLASSSWENVNNWSNGLPSGTNSAIIDNTPMKNSIVSITSPVNTLSLKIDAGDEVRIGNNFSSARLLVGAFPGSREISCAGTILLTGVAPELWSFPGTVLGGGGTISMNSASASINDNSFSNGGFVNSDMTIRGIGSIGFYFDNRSVIQADTNAGTLSVRGVTGQNAFLNSGTLLAANGGILRLYGGRFVNTGTIEARNGSDVRISLNNNEIVGGTYVTSGSGSIRIQAGQTNTLTNFTNLGSIVAEPGSTLRMSGVVVNNGQISAGSAQLVAFAPLTLNGTGEVILSSGGLGLGTLTNGADHTVRGTGGFGSGFYESFNHGTVIAVGGSLSIGGPTGSAPGLAAFNNGTFIAASGSKLAFGGRHNNHNGVIRAENGGSVEISSSRIDGGAVYSDGTGRIYLNGGTLANLTNFGRVEGVGTIAGSIVNNGSISSFLRAVSEDGTFLLSGSGIWTNPTISGPSTATMCTQEAHHTVDGAISFRISVLNRGTINGTIDAGMRPTQFFRNEGTITVKNSSRFHVVNGTGLGTIQNLGLMYIDAGSGLSLSNITGDLGYISGPGSLTVSLDSDVAATQIRIGALDVSARGRISPGGGTLGTTRVNTLRVFGVGRLDLTDHDCVIDYATLSPLDAIQTVVTSGFANGLWNGFGVYSSSAAATQGTDARTGLGYAEASDVYANPFEFSGVEIDATSVLIKYTLVGDANLDSRVDITDFARLAGAFNQTSIWSSGDFDYSGTTNISDFALLAGNFNKSLPDTRSRSSVPEPAMGLIVSLLGAMGMRRRV